MSTVADVFFDTVFNSSEKLAVCQNDVKLTWGGLAQRAEMLAKCLKKVGVGKGECVAFLSENDFRFFEIVSAAAMLGSVVVPINARLSLPEIVTILENTNPKMLICEQSFKGQTTKIREQIPSLETIQIFRGGTLSGDYESWLQEHASAELKTESVSPEEVAVVIFTSGTTGTPKGVTWSHAGILNYSYRWPLPEFAAREKQLIFVPLYVGAGGMLLYNAIHLGTENHLIQFEPGAALSTIHREKIRYVCGVTSLYQFMADHPDASKYDMSSLKLLVYGAQHMNYEQYVALHEYFGCDFKQVFGMTECPLGAAMEPEDHNTDDKELARLRLLSAGRPVDGTDLMVVNQNGEPVATDGKEVGEIILKSRSLMAGYWQRPDLTLSCMRDGFYWTNDMACVDADGFVYIQDRKDYMIKSGGMNIFPAEVEEVIMRHPSVEEAGVVGVSHPKWGKTVMAFVCLRPGCDLTYDELVAFCKEHMASYKKPRVVEFSREPLPRNAMGKIAKKILVEMAVKRETSA
jgi:long-chain acyl-CoA synthetase